MKTLLWEVMQSNSFFQQLSLPQKDRLAVGARIVKFETGTSVIQTRKPTPAIFLVLDGTLKVFAIQADGTESLLNIVGCGEVLGEINFMDGGGHSAEVETIENSTLLRIESRTLADICRDAPHLQHQLEVLIAQRIRLLSERQIWQVSAGTAGRIGRLLLSLANRYPAPHGRPIALPLRLCQSDLAALVGASRYRVHLCLHELERAGLLRLEARHRITLCDPSALSRWCKKNFFKTSQL